MSAAYLAAAMPDSILLHVLVPRAATCCATKSVAQSPACMRIASLCHIILSRAYRRHHKHITQHCKRRQMQWHCVRSVWGTACLAASHYLPDGCVRTRESMRCVHSALASCDLAKLECTSRQRLPVLIALSTCKLSGRFGS